MNKNSYIVQIVTLMSGTLIAQVIMLLSIPILTKLYTPTEFGLYSTFGAIITIIGSISSLKYDQAIMLPKENKDAEALLFLSMILTLFITFISIVIIIIFHNIVLKYFGGKEFILYLIPIGIFLIGTIQVFNSYASRYQLYKTLSLVRISKAFSIVSIQLGIRYFIRLDGLILGRIIADFISVLILLKFFLKKKMFQLSNLSKKRVVLNAKRHKDFPKYQSFTVFFSALSQNIPVLFLGSFFSPEIAGFYALTIRVLYAPTGLIGKSTKEVYYQKASKMYANKEDFFRLYVKTTFGLFKLFIIPFFIVLLFGEDIFSFIFGEKWQTAGSYSEILIFWFLLLFTNSSSVATFSILSLQKVQMKLEISLTFFRFLSIYIGYYFFNSATVAITLFTLISVLNDLFILFFIYNKVKYLK